MTGAEKAIAIIDAFAESGTIESALAEHGLSKSQFYRLVRSVPSLAEALTQARAIRTDCMVAESIAIADDPELDPRDKAVRIEIRKWTSGKWEPRTYGDRIDVNVTERVDVSLAITEAKRRVLRSGSDLEQIEDAQIVELPTLSHLPASDETSVSVPRPVQNPFED